MKVDSILGLIHVEDQGTADQPVALLWPSLFTDHSMWRHQLPVLHNAGWRTLAIDPPAHGRSPGPGRRFTMNECADAALQVLDAAGVTQPVVAIGTSWGGFVAPRIALRAPERVRGIVLFNTSADAPQPSQRIKANVLASPLHVPPFDAVVDRINLSTLLSPETLRERPTIGTGIVRSYRGWDRKELIHSVRSVLLDRAGIIEELPQIGVPAMIVSGRLDTILPIKLGRHIASRMRHSRYEEVENAAHLIPLERPNDANRLLMSFLQNV